MEDWTAFGRNVLLLLLHLNDFHTVRTDRFQRTLPLPLPQQDPTYQRFLFSSKPDAERVTQLIVLFYSYDPALTPANGYPSVDDRIIHFLRFGFFI